MGAHRSHDGDGKAPWQPKELYHREQLPVRGVGRGWVDLHSRSASFRARPGSEYKRRSECEDVESSFTRCGAKK